MENKLYGDGGMIATIISSIISLSIVMLITPYFIKFLKSIGMSNYDMHKKEKKKIPEMGGPVVLFGFLGGSFLFLWINVFLFSNHNETTTILGVIITALLATFIGMIDDLTLLSKKRKNGKRIGLKQWQKPLLTLPIAIPLMAIMAGTPTINIPFFGSFDIGILYPLIIIPIGIVATTNAYNMLAGLNGLEAGMGIILLFSLGIFAFIIGNNTIGSICFIFSFALIGFLIYNWYPAKIFPGDSLTYLIGSMIGAVTILGNFERFAILCFLPWIIEFFIKAKSRFKEESYGVLLKNGTLKAKNGIKSLTHIFMRNKKEWQVVLSLIFMEIFVCCFAFYVYFMGWL